MNLYLIDHYLINAWEVCNYVCMFLYVALRYISDINECLTTDWCAHSGICTNHNGGFSCNCAGTGYEGDTCQTGKCHRHKGWTHILYIHAHTLYICIYIYLYYLQHGNVYNHENMFQTNICI